MPARSDRAGQAGFALLEVLLSVCLLGIIVMFLSGGFSFGLRAWEKDKTLEQTRDANLINRAISEWLSTALALSSGQSGRTTELAFQGSSSRLDFVALSDGRTQSAGIVAISLRAEDVGLGDKRAVVTSSLFRRDIDATSTSPSVLAEHAFLEFSYFGPQSVGAIPAWHSEWAHRSSLPSLVAFRFIRKGVADPQSIVVRVRNGTMLQDFPIP